MKRTENVVYHKSFIAGDYMDSPLKIEVEIKEIDLSTETIYNGEGKVLSKGNTKKTTNLITIQKYKTLSISGSYRNGGGQCQDILISKEFKANKGFNVRKFKAIWDRWHLNDLMAGTQRQEETLNSRKNKPKGYDYTNACEYLKQKGIYEDRGYKYGTAWLIEELPEEVEENLKQLLESF